MRTQHTVKLNDWETNLTRKEENLLHHTKEVDLLKQNLYVQQSHIQDVEKKLNIELLEREVQLRTREEEVNYNLQRNSEYLRKLEQERMEIDTKLKLFDDFAIREQQVHAQTEQVNREGQRCHEEREGMAKKEDFLNQQLSENIEIKSQYEKLV